MELIRKWLVDSTAGMAAPTDCTGYTSITKKQITNNKCCRASNQQNITSSRIILGLSYYPCFFRPEIDLIAVSNQYQSPVQWTTLRGSSSKKLDTAWHWNEWSAYMLVQDDGVAMHVWYKLVSLMVPALALKANANMAMASTDITWVIFMAAPVQIQQLSRRVHCNSWWKPEWDKFCEEASTNLTSTAARNAISMHG